MPDPWKIFAKRTLILEKRYAPLLVKAIVRFRSSFIDDYSTHGKDYAISRLHLHHLNTDLTNLIQDIYGKAGLMGAKMSYQEIKKAAQKDASFGRNESWVQEVLDYLKIHLLNFVSLITDTMKEDITKILQNAIDQGWSIGQTVEQLKKQDLIEARARVIARTEIVRAANVGHSIGAKSLPFEVNKKWIAAGDHRTRHSHRDVNTHVTSEFGTFKVEIFKGDVLVGYDEMQYPGDASAHPSNTINCFLPDQVTSVNPDIVKKTFRSWYKGKVVTIETSGKRKFTCTPNHPILTRRGWVKAGELTSMDDLVKSDFVELSSTIDFNVKDKPTTFEKFFDSIIGTGRRMRVIGSIVNFHGDKPTGNVDIIRIDRKLRDRIKIFFLQSFCDNRFNNSNLRKTLLFGYRIFSVDSFKIFVRFISDSFVSFRNEFSSLIWRSLRHTQIHRFTLASGRNTLSLESTNDYISGNRKHFTKLLNADSRMKFGNHNIQRRFNFVSSHGDVINRKNLINKRFTHADNICDIISTHARNIHFDNVVSSVSHEYEGFVYNLETGLQMYDVNGYVAHNCRCRVIYEPKRDENGKVLMRRSDSATIIPMQGTTNQLPAHQIAATLKAHIRIGIQDETE